MDTLTQGFHLFLVPWRLPYPNGGTGSNRNDPKTGHSDEVMMAHERCGEEDAEAILSNLKMEGRCVAPKVVCLFGLEMFTFFCWSEKNHINAGAAVCQPDIFALSSDLLGWNRLEEKELEPQMRTGFYTIFCGCFWDFFVGPFGSQIPVQTTEAQVIRWRLGHRAAGGSISHWFRESSERPLLRKSNGSQGTFL